MENKLIRLGLNELLDCRTGKDSASLFFNVFILTADSIHSLDSEREFPFFRFVEFIA